MVLARKRSGALCMIEQISLTDAEIEFTLCDGLVRKVEGMRVT